MRAVVLVGGEGTRLRPLTFTTPKPLLPIVNVPFLERQLAWLAGHGVDEAVLSLGYLPDAFHAHFAGDEFVAPDGSVVRLRYAVEDTPLGTAGAIRFAAEGIDDRFVVCNGDVLTELDLGAMVAFHEQAGAEASIYLTQVEDPSAFGVVPTRPDGEVVGFIEKPRRDQAPTNWINGGTYVLEPSVLDRIPARMNVSIERETFPRMVSQRGVLYGFHSDGYWLDIGTPEKYLEAHRDLLAGALGLPPVPGLDASADDAARWCAAGAQIAPDARLEGPVVIGADARVDAGAFVHSSVLAARVHVGAGARIVRSVVLEGAHVDAGAEIVDSVLGPGATLGAGSVLADTTIVGASQTVRAGTKLSGARVPTEDPRERR